LAAQLDFHQFFMPCTTDHSARATLVVALVAAQTSAAIRFDIGRAIACRARHPPKAERATTGDCPYQIEA
jgi:hypothetical protein